MWSVHRPLVYRALDRLVELRLARPAGTEPSRSGPARALMTVTPAGRRAADVWLDTPVVHIRDVRTVLLAKVVLLRRAGREPAGLLERQRAEFRPVTDALAARVASSAGTGRLIAAWRHALARSVDELLQIASNGRLG